jgi:hypothetical protein
METEGSLPHSQVHKCSIQSITPHPTSWKSILMLSFHLRLGLPSGSFLQVPPTKIKFTPLLSPVRATCSAHLIGETASNMEGSCEYIE